MIFVTSDWHLFHENIIKYCNRPFKDAQEMNEKILQYNNEIVKPDDILINLGDVACGLNGRKDDLKNLIQKFIGKKILIKGNHDYLGDDFYRECGFETVGTHMILGDIFFCHYGFSKSRTMDEESLYKIFKKSKCKYIYHGHTHLTKINGIIPRFNVCTDLNGYKPVQLDFLSA